MRGHGSARQVLVSALAAVAVVVAMAGCSQPGQAQGDDVARWIDAQDFVESAEASVSTDPWSPGASFFMTVSTPISDDDLTELAASAARRARDAGWPDAHLAWQLDDHRSFSNSGGDVTLQIFLGMRDEPRYLAASARGDEDCGNFFCVTIADGEPDALLAEVDHLLDLADRAGGVQPNLPFEARSADGRFLVTAEPDAPVEESVALWTQIAEVVPLEKARAWVVEPVGDIPSLQLLDVTVADETAKAAAEQIAATQSVVEVTVTVAVAE